MSGKENLTAAAAAESPQRSGTAFDASQQDLIDMEGSVSAHSLEDIL